MLNIMINDICKMLPEGFLMRIELENGWGGVELVYPDYTVHRIEPEDDTIADQIQRAWKQANEVNNEQSI